MERGERIALIKKLATRLSGDTPTDIGLTLRQFELPDGYWQQGRRAYAYVVEQIEGASDAQLAELHRYLFPDEIAIVQANAPSSGTWAAGMFRLFISHTSPNRERAAQLSRLLEAWGVSAFVAHDAIEPTREWQDEIEAALRTCDALCALLTPDFMSSAWCDQEVGFAVARNVLVVPIRLGADPHGFIGKYQGVAIPEHASGFAVASGVFDALARNALTKEAMIPAIVRRYANSTSYDNTRAVFVLLETIPGDAWTNAMANEVLSATTANSQVGDAVLPGGRRAPDAAEELISAVRPDVLATDQDIRAGDDDIPF